jgi:hypothetical protein
MKATPKNMFKISLPLLMRYPSASTLANKVFRIHSDRFWLLAFAALSNAFSSSVVARMRNISALASPLASVGMTQVLWFEGERWLVDRESDGFGVGDGAAGGGDGVGVGAGGCAGGVGVGSVTAAGGWDADG